MPRIPATLACLFMLAAARAAAPSVEPAATAGRMDQIVRYYFDKRQFMGNVLVTRGDDIVFNRSYGSANLEWNIPNAANTKFRIGSLTKQFTAAAILLLEERGKVKVEDPVGKYYLEAPAAWQRITLFHLLTHTSGIPSYTELPEFNDFSLKRRTPEELVQFFRDRPLAFEPGTDFSYSNSGYALLGLIIEKVSGMSYADFIDQNIFKPLGMKDSGLDDDLKIIPNRASGYGVRRGETLNTPHLETTVPYSAGGIYSTVEDLLRWERALFHNQLLTAKSFTKMTTPAKKDYAFGLEIEERFGTRVIEHGGSVTGFRSKLAYYPEKAVTIVVLSNIPYPGAENIAEKLGALMHGQKVVLQSERAEIALPADVLNQYVGTYELRPGFEIMVSVVEGRLSARTAQSPPDPLYAESSTRFFSRAFEADFEFVRDAAGKVTHLVLLQGGRAEKGRRKEE